MEGLLINLEENSYKIYIDKDLLDNLGKYCGQGDKYIIITDENVDNLYIDNALSSLNDKKVHKIVISPGENSKNISTVENILQTMLDIGLTRRSRLIALGGGVVGDIAGFCASIYMRGIDFIQVPTTLLSQVDSSVGGKTGVNMPQGKNTIGSFYQPKAVIIDTKTLNTLSPRELISGIGEIVKYGIIYDYEFLKYIRLNIIKILELDEDIIKETIKRCCEIKAEIVSKDEKEKGLRKILNYGHTIGHALEAATNYKKYTHGEAVLMGMYYEGMMAKNLNYIDESYYGEIVKIIEDIGVSVDIDHISWVKLTEYMMKDKKNKEGKISFILPMGRGKVSEILLTTKEVREGAYFGKTK